MENRRDNPGPQQGSDASCCPSRAVTSRFPALLARGTEKSTFSGRGRAPSNSHFWLQDGEATAGVSSLPRRLQNRGNMKQWCLPCPRTAGRALSALAPPSPLWPRLLRSGPAFSTLAPPSPCSRPLTFPRGLSPSCWFQSRLRGHAYTPNLTVLSPISRSLSIVLR